MKARHILASGALAAGSLLVGAAPVQAGVAQPLVVDIDDHVPFVRDAATYDFTVDTNEDEACDASLELIVLDGDEQPVTDVTIDEGAGTVTFGPSVPGDSYDLVATCTTGSEEEISSGDNMSFARALVTKVVEGDPAPGTTFTVEVACTGEDDNPFTEELEFGTAGGTDFIVGYGEQDCEATETEDGGAEEVAISGDLALVTPDDFTATVTNTFADAPAPTPPAPAPAAQPQVVQPTFTG